MTYDAKHIYIGIGLFAIVLIGNSYISHLLATTQAETVQSQNEKFKQDIKQSLEQQLAAIREDVKNVKTPAQVAQAVPHYTPDVRPILIVPGGVPTNTSDVGGNVPSVSLPDAPSSLTVGSLVIPSEQVPAYWKSVTACAEDHANLGACQKELPLVTQERDSWKKAAKGSFWGNVKRNGKWFVIGGLAGAAGALAATH